MLSSVKIQPALQPIISSSTHTVVLKRKRLHISQHAISTLALRAMRNDGTVEDVVEADLYKYTRNRWVYNEARNLSERYLRFDLQQLIQVAVKAVHDQGARFCTEVVKCREGLNNKALLLKMDNGSVVFAKLPNPCAGPAFYTTASEVATRSFLREALELPIPRVLAWSSKADNPVGAEYILEEKVLGQPLLDFWKNWQVLPMEPRLDIIEQIVKLENKLAQMRFEKYGCIYFRKDFPEGESLRTMDPPLKPIALERYTLGPLVEHGFWKMDKANPSPNSGPYKSALEFAEARGRSEKEYVKTHGYPRLNYARSITEPEKPQHMLDLLDRYQQLARPMICPSIPKGPSASTLWHPDLHIENVFVNPKTMQITSITDWQSAAATPFFYRCGVPKLFQHREPVSLDLSSWPKHPSNFEDLEPDEKVFADNMYQSKLLHNAYLAATQKHNPRHWTALQFFSRWQVEPIRIVQHVWESNTVWFLQRALMRLADQWEELCPGSGPCPVRFSEQEKALFEKESDSREFVANILNLLQDNYGLPPEGTIDPARYDEIQAELSMLKAEALKSAGDEKERLEVEKLWPYQDTVD